MMTIKYLVHQAFEDAKEKGWHEKPATFGDRIALCHSELSEALEAFRELDNDAFSPTEPIYRSEASGKLTRARSEFVLLPTGEAEVLNKPEGIPSELADTVIRICDLCGLMGIDLERAIEEKMLYNKTRPHRHGGKKL